jgi:ABC-type Mn2+/Zn2+ transport system ATPase subunit
MKKVLISTNELQILSSEGKNLSPKVSFAVESGEALFVSGDNGTGKSSILKTLVGLHKHYAGKIDCHISKEKIQYLPQLGSLNFHLPLSLQDMLSSKEKSSLLDGLDLSKKWNTASGGERQKVLLAALFEKKPELLVLDEPFNHVDRASSEKLEEALQTYMKQNPNSAVILVSHRAFVGQWSSVRFLEIK